MFYINGKVLGELVPLKRERFQKVEVPLRPQKFRDNRVIQCEMIIQFIFQGFAKPLLINIPQHLDSPHGN
jgi:hypothetical protein